MPDLELAAVRIEKADGRRKWGAPGRWVRRDRLVRDGRESAIAAERAGYGVELN